MHLAASYWSAAYSAPENCSRRLYVLKLVLDVAVCAKQQIFMRRVTRSANLAIGVGGI